MTIVKEHEQHGGKQIIHRFANGYGASQIKHDYSYGGTQGQWEIAVLEYGSENDADWELCYDTPVTSDVLGHLEPEEVQDILNQIEALPAKGE